MDGRAEAGRAGSGSAAGGQHWVLPLDDTSASFFEAGDRRSLATFEAYRRGAMAGRLLRGEGPLSSGFRSIRPGDTVWLHAGDDVGVAGRGTVREVIGRPEPRIRFTLDRAASRVLAQDPIPGAVVRGSVPAGVRRPTSLAEHPDLTSGLNRWVELADERDERRLEPIGVTPLRRAIAHRPALLADPSLAGLVRVLRALDLAVGVRTEPRGPAYVVGLGDERLVVGCLVRGGQSATPTPAVLRTIASTSWCAWHLLDAAPSLRVELDQWFTFSRSPHAQLVRFLEASGHSVSWYQSAHLELGPRTRLRWGSPRAGSPANSSPASDPGPTDTSVRRRGPVAT